MQPCESLDPHLSALVDGELRPLEAIAIRKHLHTCPNCAREVRALEALKVRLHMVGREQQLPVSARVAFRNMFNHPSPKASLGWLLTGAAAGLLVLALGSGGELPLKPEPEPAAQVVSNPTTSPARSGLNQGLLDELADTHRRGASALVYPHRGVLTLERVPVRFLGKKQRTNIVRASTNGCRDAERTATLAVLDASVMDLDPAIEESLAVGGVYVDVIRGVDVRVSLSGGRVFVVLSDADPATSI